MSQKTSKKALAHQNLLDSAGTTLARNPAASMAGIAEKAGVGRATLYRFFPTRDDLIKALAEIFEIIVPFGDRFRFLSSEPAALKSPEIHKVGKRQRDEMAELVEAMKAEGTLDRAVPTAWVAAAIEALLYAAWESVDDGAVARRDAAGLAFRKIMKGLGNHDDAPQKTQRERGIKG